MQIFPVKHSKLLCKPEYLVSKSELQKLIQNIINNLINIKDETGEFLLRLDDGQVIDTKDWDGWVWTHGIGLYGMHQFYQQTGDKVTLEIIDNWFEQRLSEGTSTKNVNTVCPFLTLAYRYEETKNSVFLPYLESWTDWVMYDMP